MVAVESSAAVDRQAAHRWCGQQADHTRPTFPQPDDDFLSSKERRGYDDDYAAPLPIAAEAGTQDEGGDFRRPQPGTFTWPRALELALKPRQPVMLADDGSGRRATPARLGHFVYSNG